MMLKTGWFDLDYLKVFTDKSMTHTSVYEMCTALFTVYMIKRLLQTTMQQGISC